MHEECIMCVTIAKKKVNFTKQLNEWVNLNSRDVLRMIPLPFCSKKLSFQLEITFLHDLPWNYLSLNIQDLSFFIKRHNPSCSVHWNTLSLKNQTIIVCLSLLGTFIQWVNIDKKHLSTKIIGFVTEYQWSIIFNQTLHRH